MSTDDDLNLRKRFTEEVKMGQQPTDRLWAAIAVLALIAILSGLVTVIYAETTRNFLEEGRRLGYERGAVECMQVVVDNDRTFDLPNYCRREDVVFYYPPEVCDEYFGGDSADCGRLWVDP